MTKLNFSKSTPKGDVQAPAEKVGGMVPRLKVAQALTKQVQDGVAKPGDLILTANGETSAHKDLYVTPIGYIESYSLQPEEIAKRLTSEHQAVARQLGAEALLEKVMKANVQYEYLRIPMKGGPEQFDVFRKFAAGVQSLGVRTITAMLYVHETGDTVELDASKSNYMTASDMRQEQMRAGSKRHAVVFKLATKLEKGQKNQWYTLTAEMLEGVWAPEESQGELLEKLELFAKEAPKQIEAMTPKAIGNDSKGSKDAEVIVDADEGDDEESPF